MSDILPFGLEYIPNSASVITTNWSAPEPTVSSAPCVDPADAVANGETCDYLVWS